MNRGYNEAIIFALHRLHDESADGVLILASDLPLVTAGEIDQLVRPAVSGAVRVAVSRDGTGTNGLFLNPSDIIAPAFGEGSAQRHCRLAEAAGVNAETVHLNGLAFDVDTPADLREFFALQATTPVGDLSVGVVPARHNLKLSR
ncbi:MAG: hypothetical protein WD075_13290, partial [Rhodospirillales bacterium]